jgi:N-acetylglucosaminyl-diphospho-decaprenol L-rhamnosyltransferase
MDEFRPEVDRPNRGRSSGDTVVVVVLYNSSKFVEHVVRMCASSSRVIRVVLFDNASADRKELVEVTDLLKREFRDKLVVSLSDVNLGYGRAINRVVAEAGRSASRILIANPDITLTNASIEAMNNVLDTHTTVGAVAPVTVRIGGVPYERCWTTPSGSLNNFIPPVFARALGLRMCQRPQRTEEGWHDLWLEGSIFMVRAVAFESVGGFDERFFLYAEDEDLCRRLVRMGWGLELVDLGIGVQHARGASRVGRVPVVMAYYHASMYGFLRKWYGVWAGEMYRGVLCVWCLVRRFRGRPRPDIRLTFRLMGASEFRRENRPRTRRTLRAPEAVT